MLEACVQPAYSLHAWTSVRVRAVLHRKRNLQTHRQRGREGERRARTHTGCSRTMCCGTWHTRPQTRARGTRAAGSHFLQRWHLSVVVALRKCCDNCVRHILGDASSNVSERLQVALTFPNGCKLGAPWPCHSRQPLSGVPACDAVSTCVCECARAHTYPQSRSPLLSPPISLTFYGARAHSA